MNATKWLVIMVGFCLFLSFIWSEWACCITYDEVILDMRRDVQEIVKMTPQEKQVMMFSATLPRDLRVVCKKFMQDVRFSGASSNTHKTPVHYTLWWDVKWIPAGCWWIHKSCRCTLNSRRKNYSKSFAPSKSVLFWWSYCNAFSLNATKLRLTLFP